MLRTFKWCCDESGRKNQVPFFTPTITSTLSMISALNYALLGLHIPIPIPMPYPYIRSTDSVGAWFVCIIDAFGCHISLTYLCLHGRSLPMITSICNALLPLIIKIVSPIRSNNGYWDLAEIIALFIHGSFKEKKIFPLHTPTNLYKLKDTER